MTERNHPRADMGHAHQQLLPFEAVDGLAQRAATDAVGARQLRLGDLAAWRYLALHDGRLDTAKHVLGKRFRVVLFVAGNVESVEHYCQHNEF